MAENSKIEWTDHTFNPWIGCTKISPACDGCYAEAMMDFRYRRVTWGGERVRTGKSNWRQPVKWNKEAAAAGTRPRVFCASLADVFDNQVLPEWRADLFELIRVTPHLVWLLLTKRPQNIVKMVRASGAIAGNGTRYIPRNVAIGTTVEDQTRADINVPALLDAAEQCGPAFTFVSCEPLLGPVDLTRVRAPRDPEDPEAEWFFNSLATGDYYEQRISEDWEETERYDCGDGPYRSKKIDWVIAGGETDQGSHKARPSQSDWFRSLRDQCEDAGAAFHFKQWGDWLPGEANHGQFAPHPMHAYRRCDNHSYEWPEAKEVQNFGTHPDPWSGPLTARRIGKKAAGRLLDGCEYNGFPEAFAR